MLNSNTNKQTVKSRFLSGKHITLTFATLLTAALAYGQAPNTWTQKSDFGGAARTNAVGFSIGSKGYLGTGLNLGTYFKDFWEYDPALNTWSQKADFGGNARSHAVGFSIGSKGYLGTGHFYDGEVTDYKDFWEYDPAANTWTQKANFGGTGRYGAVGFSIGNKGYLGTGGGDKDFWEYDPALDTWLKKADFGGTVRLYAVGFTIGSKGYVGLGLSSFGWTKDFWEYDPELNTWMQKKDFGTTRDQAVGFGIGNKGYVGTGVDETWMKDFWEYDPALDTWLKKADFGGIARYMAVGFSIGNKGYIGTGSTVEGYKKDFWEYSLECNGMTVYADADWDSYGDIANSLFVEDCIAPSGYVADSTDCDDANASINPGSTEISNGADDNCNGIIDDVIQVALIAWYPFNGNANDETGNGYDGTVSGATLSDDRFGNPASAYSFDGINDKIVIGKEPNFPSWDTYAVSLWFLSDGGGDQGQGYGQKILSKAQFFTDFHLSVGNNDLEGNLIWWSAQGGFNSVADTNHDYRDNVWHHVVLNKKSPSNGDLWIDGVLQASSNDLQSVMNNESLVIGFTTHSDGFQRKHFSGKIDDIGIYDRALSSIEILELFTEGADSTVCSVPSNLSVTNITSSSAKLKWDAVAGAEGYTVRYKVASSEWKYGTTFNNAKQLNGLLPNTVYKWELKTFCHIDPPRVKSDWSSKQEFTTGTLRMGDELLGQVSFSIYPNPAEDHATIQFTLPHASHVYIKLYDVSGKEIATLLNDHVEQGDHTLLLNTNKFSIGIYMVKMISDFGIENQKLIVQ